MSDGKSALLIVGEQIEYGDRPSSIVADIQLRPGGQESWAVLQRASAVAASSAALDYPPLTVYSGGCSTMLRLAFTPETKAALRSRLATALECTVPLLREGGFRVRRDFGGGQ